MPVYEITDIKKLHHRRDHDVATLMAESRKWFEAKTRAEYRIAELEQTVFHLSETCRTQGVVPAKDIYFYGDRPTDTPQ